MEYWLVMAMVAVALTAVLVVFLTETDEAPTEPAPSRSRALIVLLGSSGADPATPAGETWVDLLAAALADATEVDDETTPERLAATLPNSLLEAILADAPDWIVLRLGADDLLAGTPLADFEQEFGRITQRLSPFASLAIVALDELPACAPAVPAEPLARWSATIERIAVAFGADVVAWWSSTSAEPPCADVDGRVILTATGHHALADRLVRRVEQRPRSS